MTIEGKFILWLSNSTSGNVPYKGAHTHTHTHTHTRTMIWEQVLLFLHCLDLGWKYRMWPCREDKLDEQ